jgi:hypothetical protein
LAVAAVWCLLGAQSRAAIIVYPDRVTFEASVTPLVAEDYDSVPDLTFIPIGGVFAGVIYVPSPATGGVVVTDTFLPLSPPNGIGGALTGEFFPATETMTFVFPFLIDAFGISINTFATAPGSYIAINDLGDIVPSFFDPFPGFGTGNFVGFESDTPFSVVTILAPGGAPYTLDNLRYRPLDAVPEPSTFVLAGLGLGLLGIVRMRRLRRAA